MQRDLLAAMIRDADINELTELAVIYFASWHFAFSKHFPPENLARVAVRDFEDRWCDFFADKNT